MPVDFAKLPKLKPGRGLRRVFSWHHPCWIQVTHVMTIRLRSHRNL